MLERTAAFGSLAGIMVCISGMAFAQSPPIACENQQSLEQALASDGGIMPDDCRPISIERLNSDGRDLCLVDLSQPDDGLIGSLREAAAPVEWWVTCEALSRLATD